MDGDNTPGHNLHSTTHTIPYTTLHTSLLTPYTTHLTTHLTTHTSHPTPHHTPHYPHPTTHTPHHNQRYRCIALNILYVGTRSPSKFRSMNNAGDVFHSLRLSTLAKKLIKLAKKFTSKFASLLRYICVRFTWLVGSQHGIRASFYAVLLIRLVMQVSTSFHGCLVPVMLPFIQGFYIYTVCIQTYRNCPLIINSRNIMNILVISRLLS